MGCMRGSRLAAWTSIPALLALGGLSASAAPRPERPAAADSAVVESVPPGPEPPSAAGPASPDTAAPVTATLDTLRIAAEAPADSAGARAAGPRASPGPDSRPPLGPVDGPRDPRDEPLFLRYARPAELLFLQDRLDLDKVRWRYRAAPETSGTAAPSAPPESLVADRPDGPPPPTDPEKEPGP